jgi:hypothetical protein
MQKTTKAYKFIVELVVLYFAFNGPQKLDSMYYLIITDFTVKHKKRAVVSNSPQLTKPKTQPNLIIFRKSFSTLLFCFLHVQ